MHKEIDFENDIFPTMLNEIYKRNIHSVLVEGGTQILNGFIQSGFWDEANVEVSLQQIGDGVAAPTLPIQPVSRKTFDGHEWLFYIKT